MALTTSIKLEILATLAKAFDLTTGAIPLAKTVTYTWATGTGANQADRIWHDQRTTSGTDSLDLAGSLVDVYGDAFSLARIKGLLVVAAAANAANVQVQRPASNGLAIFLAASDGVTLRPGGAFFWVAPDATGVAIAGGSSDMLDIVSASGSVTYDIVVIGASA